MRSMGSLPSHTCSPRQACKRGEHAPIQLSARFRCQDVVMIGSRRQAECAAGIICMRSIAVSAHSRHRSSCVTGCAKGLWITVPKITQRREAPTVGSHAREGVVAHNRGWRSEGPAQMPCAAPLVLIPRRRFPRPHGRGYPLSPLRGCLPAHFHASPGAPKGYGLLLQK